MIDQEIQAKLREKFNPDGSMLRKQQLRMLEILLYIDKVCKENNITPSISLTEPLKSFISALSISTPTAILIPEKTCWTILKSEKLSINPTIIIIITKEGNITPKVADIAPIIPFSL